MRSEKGGGDKERPDHLRSCGPLQELGILLQKRYKAMGGWGGGAA